MSFVSLVWIVHPCYECEETSLMCVSSYWSSAVGAIALKHLSGGGKQFVFYWRKLNAVSIHYSSNSLKKKYVIGNFWISVLQITYIILQWNGQLTCLTALTATGDNFICTCSIAPTNNAPIGYFEIIRLHEIMKSVKIESITTDHNEISKPHCRMWRQVDLEHVIKKYVNFMFLMVDL